MSMKTVSDVIKEFEEKRGMNALAQTSLLVNDSALPEIRELEASLERLFSIINNLVAKKQPAKENQLSLFSYDNVANEHQAMSEELNHKRALCNEQQAEIARLRSRLDLLEQAHKSLKSQNSAISKRLTNILGSFDATLGS
jgi:chromosome segregation ATPase